MFAAIHLRLTACATLPLLLSGCLQSALLYHPTHEVRVAAADGAALAPWCENGQLRGYARTPANPRHIWFMCHGNAGQAAHRAYVLPLLHADDALYVLEYPGYGLRPGSPGARAMNAAAADGYRAVRARHPGRPVRVLGESLGTGPASTLARESAPPEWIVLAAPYEDLREVAAEKVGGITTFLFLYDDWDNRKALAGYRGRLDILAAAQDAVIPPHHAKSLADAIPGARFHLLPGGHNDWSRQVNLRDDATRP